MSYATNYAMELQNVNTNVIKIAIIIHKNVAKLQNGYSGGLLIVLSVAGSLFMHGRQSIL